MGRLCFSLLFGLLGLYFVQAMLEAENMPFVLRECYEEQRKITNLTETVSHAIQTFCLRKYMYSTVTQRKFVRMTETQMNYVRSLAREGHMLHEEIKRGKRQNIPIRKECRVISDEEWQALADAFRALKQNTNISPNLYDTLALLHSGNEAIGNAHFGPNFLGWHRCYLYYLEIALRRVNPRVSLCFWDSTLDFNMARPAQSVMFSAARFGTGDGVVIDGPFTDWYLPNRTPQQRLRRSINERGSLMVPEHVTNILTNPEITRTSEVSVGSSSPLRGTIEGLHNNVHTWVGEVMSGVNTAPQDPVFFFHHCYIDYFWEKFREKQMAAGVDPENDYPDGIGGPLHRRLQNMSAFDWIRNEQGFTNVFTRWYFRYENSPTCQNNCSGSPYLICENNRCVSVEKPQPATDFGPRTFLGFDTLGDLMAAREGTLDIGPRFSANINDPRTGRKRRSISKLRQHTKAKNEKEKIDHSQKPAMYFGGDTLNRPVINTFNLDGVSDRKLWSWFPVRIIHTRPHTGIYDERLNEFQFPNADLHYISQSRDIRPEVAVYGKKRHLASGANKVFVQVDGLTYNGRYLNYAIVDDRQMMQMTYVYVAVKKPRDGLRDSSYITAFDSDGRVCRPKCLTSDSSDVLEYRPCSGIIASSNDAPRILSETYEDAVRSLWNRTQGRNRTMDGGDVFLEFHCDASDRWPWVYGKTAREMV